MDRMIFDFPELVQRHKMTIKGIIHVGAHEAGEIHLYSALGIKDVVLIEANPKRFNNLLHTLKNGMCNAGCSPLTYINLPDNLASITKNYIAYNYVVYSKDIEEIDFHLTSADGGADSIYKITIEGSNNSWCNYTNIDTIKVPTITLDKLITNKKTYNFLNLDVEGAELDALEGAVDLLDNIDYILCETQYKERFKDSPTHNIIESFLNKKGFCCVDKTDTYLSLNWGDALFIKK
jgi:FkbM family methyltransferase